MFHGKGGYDWGTVYSMPIWLRKFTFSAINEFHREQNEANNPGQTSSNDIPKGPNISPSYSTKASK